MNQQINHPASFRDPSGFEYELDGKFYRFVSAAYATDYDLLQSSGLAAELQKKNLLLPFTESADNHTGRSDWYKTLIPQQLSFFSYAWEWSFSQLKDAALATLTVCKLSSICSIFFCDSFLAVLFCSAEGLLPSFACK